MIAPSLMTRRCLLLGSLLLWATGHAHADATERSPPLLVFAAASLAAVMESIGAAYETEYDQAVQFSYGASSTLSRQISHGAPASVFISANPRWMQTLIDSGTVNTAQSKTLLHNSLVLVAPADSPLNTQDSLPTPAQLQLWLEDGRLAVGDPRHVPVGIYAKRALQSQGLWASVEPRLAPTENARASLALLQRAEVALGIVYASDLIAVPELRKIADIPLPSGERIHYPVAAIGPAPSVDTLRFLRFLSAEQAQQLFAEMGFIPPAEPDV